MNLRLHRRQIAHLASVPASQPATEPVSDGRASSTGRPATAADVPMVTTPFEDWCEARGVHPEAFGAWETFAFERAQGA